MKLRKYLLLPLFFTTALHAQERADAKLSVEARADYRRESINGVKNANNTGFKGNIFNILINGNLSPKFSYKYRQRLNGINKEYTFFDAIDWLFLTYHVNTNWTLSGGKWAVLCGPWEFDPAPIDCFQLFEFCYNFPCYEWGWWLGYQTTNRKDQFYLQMVESPFQKAYNRSGGKASDMYAYNLIWYGNHGILRTDWSVNFMEYAPGRFINYLSFGNSLRLTRNLRLGIDYMNRATTGQTFLFKDCSMTARVDYQPTPRLNLWAKASYDVNRAGKDTDPSKPSPEQTDHQDKPRADLALYEGTEITRVGAGMEYYPLKNKNVRLHANYSYCFGKNTNPDGCLQDRQSILDLGVTWRVNVIK